LSRVVVGDPLCTGHVILRMRSHRFRWQMRSHIQ